ncbi:MAG: hypothetical protein Q7S05_05080 [bacterium]|nr:hypothetical protein [bacterium]
MNPLKTPSSSAMPIHKSLYRKWWFWVLATPLILFIAVVIYRIPFVMEKDRTEQVVAQIHAQKLTMNDVNGEHLPPPPDPALVDATIEGVDANANGIRDDVELAIFKKYPDSARIRSAELQYAKALQMELGDTFNVETLTAVVWEESRGYFCIDSTFPQLPKSASSEEWNQQDKKFNSRITEVKNLVFNTNARVQKREDIFNKYASSHSSPSDEFCDVDFSKLAN